MPNTVFERVSADDGGLRVELLVQPAINYALVHNRVPLVRGPSITNDSDGPAVGVQVELDLDGPDGPLAAAWHRSLTAAAKPTSAGLEHLGFRRKTEKIDNLLRYGLQVAYQSRPVVQRRRAVPVCGDNARLTAHLEAAFPAHTSGADDG